MHLYIGGISALLVLLCACNPPNDPGPEPVRDTDGPRLSEHFSHVDTSNAGPSIGCVGSFYKQLSDSTVLVIRLKDNHIVDTASTLRIDSLGLDATAALWLFEKDSAHMSNICTDVIIVNLPKPLAMVPAVEGSLALMHHPRFDYYGNLQPVTSILVKHLTFADPRHKQPIVVKGELLWRVLDRGMAG